MYKVIYCTVLVLSRTPDAPGPVYILRPFAGNLLSQEITRITVPGELPCWTVPERGYYSKQETDSALHHSAYVRMCNDSRLPILNTGIPASQNPCEPTTKKRETKQPPPSHLISEYLRHHWEILRQALKRPAQYLPHGCYYFPPPPLPMLLLSLLLLLPLNIGAKFGISRWWSFSPLDMLLLMVLMFSHVKPLFHLFICAGWASHRPTAMLTCHCKYFLIW